MIRLKSLLEQRNISNFNNVTDVSEQNNILRNDLKNQFQPIGELDKSKPQYPKILNYSGFQKFKLNSDTTLIPDVRSLAEQLQTLSKFILDTTQKSYKALKFASDNFTQKNQLPTDQAWTIYEGEITRQDGPQLGTKTKWLKSYFMKKPDYLLKLLEKEIKGNQNTAQQKANAFAKDDAFRTAYMTPLSGAWQNLTLGNETIKLRVESTLSQLNQGYYDIATANTIITPVTNFNDGTNFILA